MTVPQKYDCKNNALRFHQWDDVNRLRLVLGPTQGGFYGYDANGDRVYKLTGECSVGNYRWPHVTYNFSITDAVLYPNPYLTITSRRYTKHYFAGNERVATAIGNGRWISEYPYTLPEGSHDNYIVSHTLSPLLDPYPLGNASFDTLAFNVDINNQLCVNLKYCTDPITLERIKLEGVKSLQETMTHFAENQSGSEPMYYYHSDHLGSASWITEHHGAPIQYIHYLPYGEILEIPKQIDPLCQNIIDPVK